MSLLHARGLSVRYGPKVLLDGASFALGHHDRAGLIGPNGSGKSTLLKILAGQIEPDGGAVQLVRKARAGYLPQELSELPPGSVLDGVLASVPGRSWLQARLASAEAALAQAATEEEQVELGGELAELHEQLAHHEELYGRHRAEEILGGLGVARPELSRPASELSGGWKMRAALAALLLQDPELLLLDEPTNHLDVPTLEWFDSFLRRSRKALLLVSHDREFLDRQIDRVLSLESEGLRAYAGNYERYLELRAAEEERLAAQAEKQSRRRAQMQAFIERFRAKATKARQAQSWVRGVLGSFLFSGDEVEKRIGVLSGGERARVALARLLVVPSNFLLMDEPTNHLDLDSSEALIDALTRYEGTLLFVSHNRSFVNGLATRIWEVRDGGIDAQPGDLDDWSRRRAEETAGEVQAGSSRPAPQGVQARRERALQREQRDKVLGPIKRAVAELEQRIAQLEQEKKAAEAQLADPALFSDPARSTPLITAYRDASRKLEELYARWEHKSEELAAAESRLS